jgi:hypothetical protein
MITTNNKEIMGYQSALEAAGAKVLTYRAFGSYQGDWYAKVEYQGEEGWVQGSYGSCSFCDSFEREFDYSYGDEEGESQEAYEERLKLFGEGYLTCVTPQEQQEQILETYIREDSYFGDEAQEILDYVKEYANAV